MPHSEIEQKTQAFLIKEFEVEEASLTPQARLREDLGLDSLDFVDVVVIIKRVFGFVAAPEEMRSIVTLSDLYDYIEKKIDGQ